MIPLVGGNLLYSGERLADGRYVHVYHRLRIATVLPMPRVFLHGPRCWRFCRDSQPDPNRWQHNVYDFAEDVRELACERIRLDVYAMWTDPRERLA